MDRCQLATSGHSLQARVLGQVGGEWLQCQGPGGLFYFNASTRETRWQNPQQATEGPAGVLPSSLALCPPSAQSPLSQSRRVTAVPTAACGLQATPLQETLLPCVLTTRQPVQEAPHKEALPATTTTQHSAKQLESDGLRRREAVRMISSAGAQVELGPEQQSLEVLLRRQMSAAEEVQALGRAVQRGLAWTNTGPASRRVPEVASVGTQTTMTLTTMTTNASATTAREEGEEEEGESICRRQQRSQQAGWAEIRHSSRGGFPEQQKMPLLKNRRGASHFVHAESLSEKVQSMERATLRKAVSHEDLRYPVGPWQALTRNKMFEHLTLMMVLLNVVWLGVSTNYTVEEPLGFQLVDNLFCAFFTFEILVRFLAFGQKSNIFRDYAFLFDLFLVLAMIWETWAQNLLTLILSTDIASNAAAGSSVLRIFRILRVARTTRFVRLFPELSVFLKGLLLGMRALFATLCALSFCIYIFAIVFTQLLAGTEVGVFDNVLKSMNFLFLAAITSIDKKFIGRMMDFGWLHWGLFLLYLLVANLAIMKMMTGVLVNVVTDVSKKFEEQVAVQRIQEELQRLLEHLDADHNGSVSKEEFDSMLDDETLLKSLLELGVDIVAFVEFTRPTIPPEGVYVQDLVRGMLQFRGRKVATVKDIVDTRLLLAQLLTVMHERGTP